MRLTWLILVALAVWTHAQKLPSNKCGCGYQQASKCLKRVTPGAKRLAAHFTRRFGIRRVNALSCKKQGSFLSTHAEGRAIDLIVSGAKAQRAFNYARSIACRTGIQEVIFNRRIWTKPTGLRAFPGDPHLYHVHIGLNRCGAAKFGRAK
ncbi:hypothetical protein AAVH_10824 [Aphelenchoides avenae]|nr:hypothetical protein AAVH_10824 [Aphelenchus avenae]